MPENRATSPEDLPCPICKRPLKRTADRMMSAFECVQCGPFTDFNRVSARTLSGEPGPEEPGSDPTS